MPPVPPVTLVADAALVDDEDRRLEVFIVERGWVGVPPPLEAAVVVAVGVAPLARLEVGGGGGGGSGGVGGVGVGLGRCTQREPRQVKLGPLHVSARR